MAETFLSNSTTTFNSQPMQTTQKTIYFICLLTFFFSSCAKNDNFSAPYLDCTNPNTEPNTTIESLHRLANDSIRLYPGNEKDMMSGIVVSSDQGGNFYNKLHLVDETTQQAAVIQIEMGASFTVFPPGTKILLTLGELYCTNAYGKLTIGGGIYTSSSGNKYVGSISKSAINIHIQKYCEPVNLEPYNTLLSLEELKANPEKYVNRLITIENVQFDRSLVGKKLYDAKSVDPQGYTLRKVVNQQGNSIYIRTGKLSKDFANYVITEKGGSLTGIVDLYGKQLQFYPRVSTDISFNQPAFGSETSTPEETDETEEQEEILVEPGKSLAFAGADFENWEDFLSILKRPGLKFATQAPTDGWNNSTGLAFRGSPTKTDNAFTLTNIQVPPGATALSFLLKGTANAKSLSINLYQTDGFYVAYNLEHLSTSKIIVPTTHTNQQGNVNKYKGIIDTQGQWIKVILDLEDIPYNTTGEGDFLTFRFSGKTATIPSDYDLILDEIRFEEGE
ncbi:MULTISPECIES: DUF5689 domain-containing protein [unclassified Myroides]|uniref:DUF5689 domain-containing protein n=1 Tax=unclassified Myroides TaxID=2642485 RepID=UPI002576A20F|nr:MULTISPECIES: DUF5689 domain-containing protein [unclassified Myroides]